MTPPAPAPGELFTREALALYASLRGYPLRTLYFTYAHSAPGAWAPCLQICVTWDYGVTVLWPAAGPSGESDQPRILRTFRPPEGGLWALGHGDASEEEVSPADLLSRVWGEVRSLRHLCQTCPQIARLGSRHQVPLKPSPYIPEDPTLPEGWGADARP